MVYVSTCYILLLLYLCFSLMIITAKTESPVHVLFLECPEGFFLCDKNRCIEEKNVCDNKLHCRDASDEYGCECSLFGGNICLETRECFFSDQKCDGIMDCKDETDEKDCPQGTTNDTLSIKSDTTTNETNSMDNELTTNDTPSTKSDTTTNEISSIKSKATNLQSRNRSNRKNVKRPRINISRKTIVPSSTITTAPKMLPKNSSQSSSLLILATIPTATTMSSKAITTISSKATTTYIKKPLIRYIIPDSKNSRKSHQTTLTSKAVTSTLLPSWHQRTSTSTILNSANNNKPTITPLLIRKLQLKSSEDLLNQGKSALKKENKDMHGCQATGEGQREYSVRKKGISKNFNCFCMNTNSTCQCLSTMKRAQPNLKGVQCSRKKYKRKNMARHSRLKTIKKKYGRKIFKRVTEDFIPKFPEFSGDQVSAYGGKMVMILDNIYPLTTVSFYFKGHGMVIRRKKRKVACPKISIPLVEKRWKFKINGSSYVKASREQLLIVLSNIQQIKVKVILLKHQKNIKIQHFSLPYASENLISTALAPEVEICNCPEGYEGHSCERCSKGFRPKVSMLNNMFSFKCVQMKLPSVSVKLVRHKQPKIMTVDRMAAGNLRYVFEFNNTQTFYRVSLKPFEKLIYQFFRQNKNDTLSNSKVVKIRNQKHTLE